MVARSTEGQPPAPQGKTSKRFFLGLLAVASLLLLMTLWPLASPLFLAAVLATILWPAQRWLTRRFQGKPILAASLLVLGIVVLVFGPLVGFSGFIVGEASAGYDFVSRTVRSEGVQGLVGDLPEPIQRAVKSGIELLPDDTSKLEDAAKDQLSSKGGTAAAAALTALYATGSLLFATTMMLIALFFLLLEGKQLLAWIDSVTPARRNQLKELFDEFKKVSYSVIVSTLLTSAVQAGAALIGFFIASVPHPLFFGAITFFFACIPAIGAAAVCLVASLLIFVTGHPYMALFLAVWGVVIVGLADNVVKPLLMRGDAELDGAVIFFSLIGGLASFGAIGLLIGPLAVSLFLAVLRIYRRDYQGVPEPEAQAQRAKVEQPVPRGSGSGAGSGVATEGI
jgi:predicted PurR-regulated permease PerM